MEVPSSPRRAGHREEGRSTEHVWCARIPLEKLDAYQHAGAFHVTNRYRITRMTFSLRGAVLAGAVCLAAACVAPRGAPHPAPLAAIDAAQLPATSSRFLLRFAATSADTLAMVGTRTVTERTNGAVIERVILYDYGSRGRTVDTTLSVARTLAPIAERTYKPRGAIVLDFAGRIVTGRLTTGDGTRVIADTLGAPAFNSTDLDLVVRRLPLAAGYTTRLPLYDPEFGGFRHADARVSTRRTADGDEAWLVQVRDGKLDCEYELDARTREVRTIVVRLLASGGEYRMERVAE